MQDTISGRREIILRASATHDYGLSPKLLKQRQGLGQNRDLVQVCKPATSLRGDDNEERSGFFERSIIGGQISNTSASMETAALATTLHEATRDFRWGRAMELCAATLIVLSNTAAERVVLEVMRCANIIAFRFQNGS